MAESFRQERTEQSQAEQEQTQRSQAEQSHPLAEPASLPHPAQPSSMGQQLTPRQLTPPSASPSSLEQQTGVITSEGLSTFVRRLFVSFVVSFKGIGVHFPIIASVMAVIFFFYYDGLLEPLQMQYWPKADAGFLALMAGLLCALVIVLVYACCSAPFVAYTNRGMQDHVLLEIREKELCARLSNLELGSEDDMIKSIGISGLKQGNCKLTAFSEAGNTYFALHQSLYSPKMVQLLSNSGDVYAWAMAYHTEEALTEIDAIPILIREAMSDYAAIQASTIDDREALLEKLERAINILELRMGEDVNESESDKKLNSLRKEVQEFPKEIRELRKALEIKNIISNQPHSPAEEEQTDDRGNARNSQPDAEAEILARAAIRYVKYRLHKFQQDRLAGVLQARNNLVLSILASELITYALLVASIIAIPTSKAVDAFISPFTSVVAIYIIGVAAGLFGRLYAEANKENAVNDYGLFQARLQAIPLISGLAALGGVFLTAIALPATNQPSQLPVFTLNTRYILAAIIFGFAPNLLIRNFQQKADQYASDLESTRKK